ncbi:HAMP domain-containing histidine kinase [Clostridium gasigenes]|nr:HAMP domain-containing histidine kinase [Clostridium gasigenes]
MSIFLILGILFGIIMILHVFDSKLYTSFVNSYNKDPFFVIEFIAVMFIVFIVLMCFIFMRRMNKITDYIEEISANVNEVANGNMDINIPIKTNNELGSLAIDVNRMASNIKELIEKEREQETYKNNLITNLSHDLRTPLTSAIGFLELIKNKKYENDCELNHFCEVSLNKANELKSSVDQLFEFTKISNGEIKLNRSKIYINELIEQVTMGFIPSFEENNMEYRILSTESKITIDGDATLLARAFQNIISNAIKYGSEGKYLDINIEKEENTVGIRFVNYGDIIEEEDLKSLFERLYRVEKQCNRKEGTGLGLVIVKTIVEIHKGHISISSSKEKTEFEITL